MEMYERLILFWLSLLFLSCEESAQNQDSGLDGDVEQDSFSWSRPPDGFDIERWIVPWEGPLPVRAFRQDSLIGSCGRPHIIPDGNGGVIIVAPARAACEGDEGSCTPLFAQRISSNGTRLWGDYGVRLTEEDPVCSIYVELYSGLKICGDGSGGAYIVSPGDYSELTFYVNRINAAGMKKYVYLQPMEMPLDELIEMRGYYPDFLEPSRIIATRNGKLVVATRSIYGTIYSDYFLTVLDEDLAIERNDYLAGGSLISYLFMTADSRNLYLLGGHVSDGVVLSYWFLDGDGEMMSEGSLLLNDISSGVRVKDYDRGSRFVYGMDGDWIYKIEVDEEENSLEEIWGHNDFSNRSIQEFMDIAGDGMRGLVIAGYETVRFAGGAHGDCFPDTCRRDLLISWVDENGTEQIQPEAANLDKFAADTWYPNSKLIRSVNGDMIHLWMVPLVNLGNAIPDYFSYEMGYYLCAQRHSLHNLSVWSDVPCLKVAQVRKDESSFFNSGIERFWWFDAVEDGEGGTIIVFYSYASGIMAQRVSAGGMLIWDGR